MPINNKNAEAWVESLYAFGYKNGNLDEIKHLLDQAVKMAAEADEPLEMNFIRKHALAQAEEMGINLRQAATRVFSNASGSYSSNVNLAIFQGKGSANENGTWENEAELQEMYLGRKSFAFSADNPGTMAQNRQIFETALKTADVTFQNLDSSEISLTDERGYWETSEENLDKLRDLYQEVEDRIEGVE